MPFVVCDDFLSRLISFLNLRAHLVKRRGTGRCVRRRHRNRRFARQKLAFCRPSREVLARLEKQHNKPDSDVSHRRNGSHLEPDVVQRALRGPALIRIIG